MLRRSWGLDLTSRIPLAALRESERLDDAGEPLVSWVGPVYYRTVMEDNLIDCHSILYMLIRPPS